MCNIASFNIAILCNENDPIVILAFHNIDVVLAFDNIGVCFLQNMKLGDVLRINTRFSRVSLLCSTSHPFIHMTERV